MKKLYTLIATCLLLLFVTPLQSIDAGVAILEVVALVAVAHEAVAVLEVVALAEVVQVVVLLLEAAIVLAVVTQVQMVL